MTAPLDGQAILDALEELDGWAHHEDALEKTFVLADFRAAMAFMVRVGFEAEERDHHPELKNVYKTVDVRLTTHDAGNRVTHKDMELARAIDAIGR